MLLVVEQLGIKLACCSQCLLWMMGRALEKRMQVNSFSSIEKSEMPLWLLQISLSLLCFQKGIIILHLQSSGSSSWIQTWLIM